jgi:TetR/AcrR family transcriptional regulator, transcriptional repressor for nem operon
MARPREFDEDQALDRALEVFWKLGYANTSLDDLTKAMGIQRGSFYNTFGSKRETYLRALMRYADVMTSGGPYSQVAHMEPGLDSLQHMFSQYIDSVTGGKPYPGCFFVHASKEHRGDDPEIQRVIQLGIGRMQAFIEKSIEVAQKAGDLPPHLDPHATALAFMSLAWGLHVMADAGVPKKALVDAGRQLFAMSRTAV